ncbi:MAG: AfsR/SARP family transcriptional regulator [Mycobacteriales bacterium]
MRFGVLGPVAVWTSGGDPVRVRERKVRALLADLLVHAGRPVPASRLIDDIWGEELPGNPTNTLQIRVSQLRRALEAAEPGGRALVVSQPPGYLLRAEPDAVDADRFRALATRARATADPRARAALLADALALWRGPAYADVADLPFATAAILRLDEERLVALEEHAEARLELGEHHQLVGELADLVARHPLRQRLRAVHLRALARAGRPGEALASYADLRGRLADELGLDPSAELAALHQAILRQDADLAAGTGAAPVPAGALPAPLTELIGREGAVRRLRARLESARLVTLTGPGGVGKTRLAVETAREHGDEDGDAFFAELTALDRASAADVAGVVATALGLPAGGPEVLAGAVRDRRLLLVLDNCEHVVEAAAEFSDRLLRAAPRLRVLATSREPLGVFGEQVWAVPPLELPEPDADPEVAEKATAVRLFVARAAAADPGFALTAGNAGAVVAICRRLDGIPLALELAATRIRGLGVHDLAARLDDRFRLLAGGGRGAPARQRTLQAVIDWSWELLTEPERAVLRRLAVAADGCTLRAAEAVCAGGEVATGDVPDLLARLVDRSLAVRADGTAGARYRLLETVRAYCLDRLREAGELADTLARYAGYYGGLARHAEPRLYGHHALFSYLSGLDGGDATAATTPVAAVPGTAPVRTVTSRDGTAIAYDRYGDGPPVVLVGGALNDRATLASLAEELAGTFTVYSYDRRGRGGSGDTPPYAVEREIEDLAALLAETGGPAAVFGVSSGAVLAAEAAARGLPIRALVLNEPPFILDGSRPPMPADFADRLTELVTAGRRGDAVELFLMTAVEMPAEVVAPMRNAPLWPGFEAMAHTLAYDVRVMGDFTLPAHWATAITVPALVLDGSESLAWRRHTARAVAAALPGGEQATLEGHPHDADARVLAPILASFLTR